MNSPPLEDERDLSLHLRDLVAAAMADTGTRQKDLAGALGCTPQHISQLMSGRTRIRIDVADQLLHAMGWELRVSMRPRALRNLAP